VDGLDVMNAGALASMCCGIEEKDPDMACMNSESKKEAPRIGGEVRLDLLLSLLGCKYLTIR